MSDMRGSARNRPYASVSVTHDVQDDIRSIAVQISAIVGKRIGQSDATKIALKVFADKSTTADVQQATRDLGII